jgi:HAD superfamily hydrolase (TIGR01458 family)
MLNVIQGIIFDIDGVLEYQGRTYPGALALIAGLHRKGILVRFLTNSTLKSRHSAAEKLRLRGFSVEDHEVITASWATAQYLRERSPRSIWLVLEGEGSSEFQDFLHDDQEPEYVVIGDGRDRFNFSTMNQALHHLRKGAQLVGMISELIDSSLGELELNVGSWVRMLEAASGVKASYIGKPNAYAFELCLRTMALPKEAVLMVGDRVGSDIIGAHMAGIRSCLIKTGEFRREELETSSVTPDMEYETIADFLRSLDLD